MYAAQLVLLTTFLHDDHFQTCSPSQFLAFFLITEGGQNVLLEMVIIGKKKTYYDANKIISLYMSHFTH